MSVADQKKIHVVHIIPTLNIGGAERFVISLTGATDTQIRHTIVTLWDSTPLISDLPPGVTHVSFGIDNIPRVFRVRRLAALLRELGADIVHTHLFSADLWGRLAARRAGVPVITTEHNVNVNEPWYWRLIKRLMRHYTQRYIAPSTAISTYLQQAYGVASTHIAVIPHGIDTARFALVPAPTFGSPYRLVVIGRLVKQKGHHTMIDALASVPDVPLSVTIVGSGELLDELQAYAVRKGVSQRITWQSAVHDVSAVYGAVDIVIVPSLWEGFGLVALEAMASGRLVIASDVGGLSEIVTNEKTGLLFTCGDSDALAQTLRRVVSDGVAARSIASQAQQWVLSHGDISTMAAQYTALYRQLVS